MSPDPSGSATAQLRWYVGIAFMGGAALATAASALAEDAPAPHAVIRHVDDVVARSHPKGVARIQSLASPVDGTRNASVAVLEMDPGAAVPVHRDPTEEYVYVLEGGGTITIDGQQTALRAGHLVYMPADAEVSFTAGADGRTRVLQVFAPSGPEQKYSGWK